MCCRLTILASGSSGNCAYLETDTTRLLIDAGLSAKQIEEKLASIGRSAANLHAILLTHEHSDHILGLRVLASRYKIPIYANPPTRDAVLDIWNESEKKSIQAQWKLFHPGQHFVAGDFDIEAFTIPHDAIDPVGFLIHRGHKTIGFLTDLGHTNQMILSKARQATTLILETNYDVKLLLNHPNRPWSLKQRINGRHGHLSNDDAAEVLGQIMSDRLEQVYLSHLSRECNEPSLAEKTILQKLKTLGASHLKVTVAKPFEPSPTEFIPFTPKPPPAQGDLFAQPSLSSPRSG